MTGNIPVPARKSAVVVAQPWELVPGLIADAGEQASWRYVEFFTANIRNPNTRRAYARACSRFLTWCDERSLVEATEVTQPIVERYQRWLFYHRRPDGRPLSFQTRNPPSSDRTFS